MYAVTFKFYNEYGTMVKDYLNDNGKGFTLEDAEAVARQLREHGNHNVVIKRMKGAK